MVDFHTGCSGFYNRHWKGVFYPEKMAQEHWFTFYCEHFDTLELNTTFYRFPRAELLKSWFDRSPGHFQFSVKAPRIITHLKKFNDCKTLIDDFYRVCDENLQHKLACLLFQLPPSFSYTEERLEMLCRELYSGSFRQVVEFRHESWWQPHVFEKLSSNRLIFCTVSHPKLPDVLVPNMATVYVRMHGVPEMFYSDYNAEALGLLYTNIKGIKTLKEAFVYFNNTADIAGIVNAGDFKALAQS